MENICCICLRQDNLRFIHIFDQTQTAGGNTIAQILEKYAHYKVRIEDELPHQICTECMEEVHNAYYFIKKAESAYRKLLHMLGKATMTSFKEENSQVQQAAHVDGGEEVRKHGLEKRRNSTKECHVCGKSFPHSRQLRGHLALQHPCEGLSLDMQCPICYRQFLRKDHMKRHLRNVHKQEVPGYHSKPGSNIKQEAADETINYTSVVNNPLNDFINSELPIQQSSATANVKSEKNDPSKLLTGSNTDSCNYVFQCVLCERRFSHKHHLKRHLTNVHKQNVPSIDIFGIKDEIEIDLDAKVAAIEVSNISTAPFDVDNADDDDEGVTAMNEIKFPVASIEQCNEDVKPTREELDAMVVPVAAEQQKKSSKRREFQCHICQRIFKRKDHVRRHVQLVHKQDMDGNCLITSTPNMHTNFADIILNEYRHNNSIAEMNSSRIKHKHNKKYVITNTVKVEEPLPALDSQNPDLQCLLCLRFFSRKDNLRRHLHKVHKRDDIKCESTQDDDNTILKETILDECLNYSNETYSADHPSMPSSFSTEQLPNDKQCPICQRLFSNKQHMKRHLINVHKDLVNSNEFNMEEYFSSLKVAKGLTFENHCPICQRHFVRKSHVKRHVYTVHKEILPDTSMNDDMIMDFEDHDVNGSLNQSSSTHWMNYENNGTNFATCASATITNSIMDDNDINTCMKDTFYNLGIEPELEIKVEPKDDFLY